MKRPICTIAREITQVWKKPSIYAKPYLDVMLGLYEPTDMYICDRADDIVLRFLSNASSFRGEDARRLKQELKDLING